MLSFHFSPNTASGPTKCAIDISPYPHVASDEASIVASREVLRAYGLPTAHFDAVVRALKAARPAEGLITWVSFQPGAEPARITFDFSPRCFLPAWGRQSLDPKRIWPSPIEQAPSGP